MAVAEVEGDASAGLTALEWLPRVGAESSAELEAENRRRAIRSTGESLQKFLPEDE